MGMLTAGSATGQLVFLPVVAAVDQTAGWRVASLVIAGCRAGGRAARAPAPARPAPGPRGAALRRGRRRTRRSRCCPARGAARRRCRDWPSPPDPHVLGAAGRLRDLRGHHQRADRHALRARRPRPRHGRRRPPRACSPSSASSTSSARSPPAGSPTASTRGSCSPCTTRARGRRWRCCRRCSATPCIRAWSLFVVVYGLDWVATVPPTVALCRQSVRRRRDGRVRLGVRLAPARCGGRVGRRRAWCAT